MSPTPDMAEVEARVAKGLKWLKTVGAAHGFNHVRIDIDGLDMGDSSRCAFTQAGGGSDLKSYIALRDELTERGAGLPSRFTGTWDGDHGFWAYGTDGEDYDPFNCEEEYAMLNLAWVRALRADPQWRLWWEEGKSE